ncbi:MAG: NAD(P)/FAD-dependent oxidoreductase [Candidatus Eiseniibacteriota bacterium]
MGAGPAGVAATLWARGRFDVTLLERAASAGGQLRAIHFALAQLPGIERADGPALADACARQLEQSGAEVRYRTAAASLELVPRPAVRTEDGERLEAEAVLVATGLSRRRLEVPGEHELEGRGVSFSATLDRERFAGRDVLVVGGGDGAFENALLLAEVGCRVTLVARAAPRARVEFTRRVAGVPAIQVRPHTRVLAFLGRQHLEAARLEGPAGASELPIAGVVIKIGSSPNAAWCEKALETANGFVRAGRDGRTSATGVWAAGDVTGPALFAISVAESHGALAIHDAWRSLGLAVSP